VVNIVEVKFNPNDVFKAQLQLERSEYIFGQVFKSICQSEVLIQKIIAIPTHKDPHQLNKIKDASLTVLQFEDGKEADLTIFGKTCSGADKVETSSEHLYNLYLTWNNCNWLIFYIFKSYNQPKDSIKIQLILLVAS